MLRKHQKPLAILMALLQYFYAITAHGIPAPRALPEPISSEAAPQKSLLEEAAASLSAEEAAMQNLKKSNINHLADELLRQATKSNQRGNDYDRDLSTQALHQSYSPTNTFIQPSVDNNGHLGFSYPIDLPVLGLVPTVGISYHSSRKQSNLVLRPDDFFLST